MHALFYVITKNALESVLVCKCLHMHLHAVENLKVKDQHKKNKLSSAVADNIFFFLRKRRKQVCVSVCTLVSELEEIRGSKMCLTACVNRHVYTWIYLCICVVFTEAIKYKQKICPLLIFFFVDFRGILQSCCRALQVQARRENLHD